MNKVSKSIKKFRSAVGMTQNELAEKLFVSRQTVSSWESGRTQPDIEMLMKLSDALTVSIEELIYGEKPKTVDDGKNEKSRKVLTVVFSVLASALVGIGAVLVFVTYWSEFPYLLKTVFSFLPMLAGQAAAVWTFIKKYDRVEWREGAAVLWCAGVAATVALVDSVLNLSTDFLSCAIIDAVLFLPVIYIMDAVAPLLVYYVISGVYAVNAFDRVSWGNMNIGLVLLSILLLFTAGAFYVFLHRKQTGDARHIYSVWITAAAYIAYAVITSIVCSEMIFVFPSLIIPMYVLSKKAAVYFPFKLFSRLSLASFTAVLCFLSYDGIYPIDSLDFPIFSIICVCLVIASIIFFFISVKPGKENVSETVYFFSNTVLWIFAFISVLFDVRHIGIVVILLMISAVVQAVSLVLSGGKENDFISLNIGLVTVAALIMEIILMQNFDMLIMGIVLILLGAALFAVNFCLIRKSKKEVKSDE